jgi:hypothetical protein
MPPRPEAPLWRALGLPPVSRAEHTQVFVLALPPYAAIHLGPEGKLGGVGADRVAGFWRALGLEVPAEPDHLATLLGLYANLGQAEPEASRAQSRQAVARARAALLFEHLWSWLPGYLRAVTEEDIPSLSRWSELLRRVLRSEVQATGVPHRLPLALREAPGAVEATVSLGELTDAVLAPARSGLVLTHHALRAIAREQGLGYRAGERRFALRSLLEQDARATLAGLGAVARRWTDWHAEEAGVEARTARWWRERAEATAAALEVLSQEDR